MRNVLLTVVATSLLLAVPASPALAVPGGWVDVDDDEPAVELGASDVRASDGGGGTRPVIRCTWSAVDPDGVDIFWGVVGSSPGADALADGDGKASDPLDYDWYVRVCPDGSGGSTFDFIPVPRDRPPVDPTILRDEAIDRLALPAPAVAMNPPSDQVVHVESWLWIDDAMWTTHARSVSAGGVTTTVEATPRRVVWDMGNGDTVICEGPGTPYDASRSAEEQTTHCSYVYAHSSAGQTGEAYSVTATVEWEVSWSVVGAAGGGALPAMFTSAPVQVRVAEMQALNQ